MPGRSHVLQEAAQTKSAGNHRAGVPRADDGFDLAFGEELPATADGVVGFLAKSDDGRFFHADDLRAVEEIDAFVRAARFHQRGFHLSLIADEDNAELRVGIHGKHRAGDDRLGRMIAAHRVERDLHGLLLLFHHHDLTALVVAAVRADAVRQHRLFAPRAILNLHGFEMLMATALALPGMRRASLRNGHDCSPCS